MKIPPDKNIVEVSAYWTWMENDGVARTKVKPNAVITLKEAKENSEAVQSLFTNKPFLLLIDSRDIKSMDKQARDYLSLNNRNSPVKAFAVLVSSPLSRIIGNFFMGLNKPRVPAKLFNDELKALHWLNQQE